MAVGRTAVRLGGVAGGGWQRLVELLFSPSLPCSRAGGPGARPRAPGQGQVWLEADTCQCPGCPSGRALSCCLGPAPSMQVFCCVHTSPSGVWGQGCFSASAVGPRLVCSPSPGLRPGVLQSAGDRWKLRDLRVVAHPRAIFLGRSQPCLANGGPLFWGTLLSGLSRSFLQARTVCCPTVPTV